MSSTLLPAAGSAFARSILVVGGLFAFVPALCAPVPASSLSSAQVSDPVVDGTWVELPPPLRSSTALGYDSARLIVAGGAFSGSTTVPVTWSFDLAAAGGWSRIATTGGYDGTGGRTFVDRGRRHLLLVRRADAWVLDVPQLNWTYHVIPNPIPYTPVGIAFDPTRNRVLFMGGYYNCGSPHHPQTCHVRAVWSWPIDGDSALVEVTSPDPAPLNRNDLSAMVDPLRDRLIAFTDRFDSMRTLTFSDPPRWDSIAISGEVPDAATIRTSFYDAHGDQMVSYGGPDDIRTLSLGSSPRWTRMSTTSPIPSLTGAVTYDSDHRRILLAAGGTGSFWSYSLETASWSQIVQAGPAISFDSMILDSAADRLVVFGGFTLFDYGATINYFNDVWTYPLDDRGLWSRMQTAGTPPAPRSWPGCIYDSANDRMIIFGGDVEGIAGNDTWSLSLGSQPAWEQLTFDGDLPAPRFAATAIYDPVGQRMIVYGGSNGTSGSIGDVWSLDLGPVPRWEQLTPGGDSPGAMMGTCAAYDSHRRRMVVVDPNDVSAVWVLRLAGAPRWDRVPTSGLPTTAGLLQCVYDPALDRLIVDVYHVGLFQLLFAQTPAQWSPLNPAGTPPHLGRSSYPDVFDPSRRRMLEFGGQLGFGYVNDLFALQWDPPGTTPVVISVVSTDILDGRARVVWQLSQTQTSLEVERSEGGGPWMSRATVMPDGLGRISVEDADVRAGIRYGYRVTDGSTALAAMSEVWIDIPVAAELSLAVPAPNPATTVFFAQVTLPRQFPGVVRVLDVNGRRLASQSIGALPAGTHLMRFNVRTLPAGVYFVQLCEGNRSLVRRFSIVR